LDAKSAREKYTEERTINGGVRVIFRPIECTDQEKHKEFFKALSPTSIHYRFFEIIKDLPNAEVEKFCSINYEQEMAIVAEPVGEDKIVGVVRLVLDDDKKRGEFALVVADAWQGQGLGGELTDFIVQVARDFGLIEIRCLVSSDNFRMIKLAEIAGFKMRSGEGDVLEMYLPLNGFEQAPMA
jgi:acetyltransferase